LVDPEIDPATPQSGMAAAGRQALQLGLSIAYKLVDQIPTRAKGVRPWQSSAKAVLRGPNSYGP